MVVQKIKISPKEFAPNIPEGLEYESCILNPDGETYTITFTAEQLAAMSISPGQGKAQLDKMGLYDQVAEMVEQSPRIVKIFWDSAQAWEITSPTLIQFAEVLEIDLKEFFNEARKINI